MSESDQDSKIVIVYSRFSEDGLLAFLRHSSATCCNLWKHRGPKKKRKKKKKNKFKKRVAYKIKDNV